MMPHASLLPTAHTHGRRHVHPAGITKHLRSVHHRSLDLSSLPEPWLGAPREHSQYFARPSAADLAPSRPRAASAAMPLSHDVTTSVTCRTSSFYSDDDLDAAAWQSVDRAAMTYSNGRLIYDDADAHKPILAPLTEAALLSHAGNHVQSRFSSSPVVVSAFSFSDIGSREHSSASDILIDYEMVLQPSPVKSNSWNVDFCEIGDAVLLRNARTVPPAAVSQHMVANEMMRFPAVDDSVAISVGNPHTALQSQPHQHAGSPVELCPLASWEDPSPKPPVCTPEYKKLAGHLSEWAAEMILRLVRGPGLDAAFQPPTLDSHGRRKDTVGAPTLLVENIRYCLMSTLLQPSVVFLAMYYICKLPVFARAGSQPPAATQRFRNAVFGDDAIGPQIKNEYELYAPFKVFVNGVLLASKTLDDATFSNRVWHEISRVPVQEINAIELASLELLSYDLTVAAEDWTTWLELLRNNHIRRAPYPAPIGPLGQTPHGALLQVFETLIAANTSRPHNAFDGPVFLGLQERIDERLKVLRVWFNVDEDLDEDGPLRDEYRPHSHPTPTVVSPFRMAKAPPPDLPPPAEWLPEADPIVSRPQRSSRPVWPDMGAYHPEQPIYQLSGGVAFPSGNGFGYAAAYHPQVGPVYAPYNPQQQPQQPSYQFNIYRTCCV